MRSKIKQPKYLKLSTSRRKTEKGVHGKGLSGRLQGELRIQRCPGDHVMPCHGMSKQWFFHQLGCCSCRALNEYKRSGCIGFLVSHSEFQALRSWTLQKTVSIFSLLWSQVWKSKRSWKAGGVRGNHPPAVQQRAKWPLLLRWLDQGWSRGSLLLHQGDQRGRKRWRKDQPHLPVYLRLPQWWVKGGCDGSLDADCDPHCFYPLLHVKL